ncbi:DUF2147 domain-containing protein [Halovulum sp. GXIMD14793]
MRKHLLVAGLMLIGTAAQAQSVDGTWKTETSDQGAYLHVRIGNCSNNAAKKCGVITKVVNSDNQSIVGKPIIWGMSAKGAATWNGGRIWAPDDDKTYRSNMKLNGNTLRVEGCVAVFCRGQNWSRVK